MIGNVLSKLSSKDGEQLSCQHEVSINRNRYLQHYAGLNQSRDDTICETSLQNAKTTLAKVNHQDERTGSSPVELGNNRSCIFYRSLTNAEPLVTIAFGYVSISEV